MARLVDKFRYLELAPSPSPGHIGMARPCHAYHLDDDALHPARGTSGYAGIRAKINELLRVHGDARNEITKLDEQEPK